MTKSAPIRKAVFPVGGLGTRFLPATKAMPKEMLTVVDKPLIQYAVEEACEAGIEEFILISSRGKTTMSDHFDRSYELEETLKARDKTDALSAITSWLPKPGQICVARQQKPMGLGHAVWCARNLINNEPFAVLLADDLIQAAPGVLKQMIESYHQVGGNIVAIQEVPRDKTDRYGILKVTNDDGKLVKASGLIEKPDPEIAPSTLSIIGRYILQPEVMTELNRHEKGTGGEIQLTDAISRTIKQIPFHGLRFQGRRFDCGSKEGFIQANVAFALEREDLNSTVRELIKEIL